MDTVSYENNCKQVSEYTRKKIKVGQERAVNWLYRVTSARGGKATKARPKLPKISSPQGPVL